MKLIILFVLAAGLLAAQPQRVEVFALAGYWQGHDDEGSLGTGPVFGGALLAPLSRRFAVDFDVSHGRSSRDAGAFHFRLKTTMVSPSLLARWGTERLYGFAGGGAGVEFDRVTTRAGVNEFQSSSAGLTVHARAGFVARLSGRLLLRTDFVVPFRYVAPNITVKAGLGYRF